MKEYSVVISLVNGDKQSTEIDAETKSEAVRIIKDIIQNHLSKRELFLTCPDKILITQII